LAEGFIFGYFLSVITSNFISRNQNERFDDRNQRRNAEGAVLTAG